MNKVFGLLAALFSLFALSAISATVSASHELWKLSIGDAMDDNKPSLASEWSKVTDSDEHCPHCGLYQGTSVETPTQKQQHYSIQIDRAEGADSRHYVAKTYGTHNNCSWNVSVNDLNYSIVGAGYCEDGSYKILSGSFQDLHIEPISSQSASDQSPH